MKLKLVTLLAFSFLVAPAMAGGFDHYDTNADGYISADELGEMKAHKMQKYDANGDNLISKEEFEDCKGKKRGYTKT